MRGYGPHIGQGTILPARNVAVAHERDLIALYPPYAVKHIAPVLHLGQRDQSTPQVGGRGQDDTLTAADDERQHAASRHGQGDAVAVAYQCHSLVDDYIALHIVLLVMSAAASSGRHSMCHTPVAVLQTFFTAARALSWSPRVLMSIV